MEKRVYIKDLKDHVEKEVTIAGFVDVRRDQGKMIFFDFRDVTGTIQGVVLPKSVAMDIAKDVRSEWVLQVIGKVNKRPEKNINANILNGDIELEILQIKVLNKSETPPIDLATPGYEIGEEHRLKYRYLDLRRPRLAKNIKNRHKLIKFTRDFLDHEGFFEIETPILTKSTPEGARDFIVPSRLDQGHFYALPQSPQQYKQLLMVAGFEKYFQIARCMRDEDTRGDRQPEFTQLDIEMSFVEEEDVISLNERLLIELVKKLYPEKKIQEIPFPRITYKEAMAKYKIDRPDLREDKTDPNLLAFCWIVDFPFFEKTEDDSWTFTHNPFSAPKPEHMSDFMKGENIENIKAAQYDIVLNGIEIGGGSIRNHNPEALKKFFQIIGHKDEDIEHNFGHMLKALAAGAPPHGGDRLLMLLENEPSIREVIAFPKTGEGRDLMMESPSEVPERHLKELGIKIVK